MTTLTIQIPDSETGIITIIAEMVKDVKGSNITIYNDDEGLTEREFVSLKKSLKEATLIKKGELKPLSMNDLWDDDNSKN